MIKAIGNGTNHLRRMPYVRLQEHHYQTVRTGPELQGTGWRIQCKQNPESTTSSALLKGVRSCRIRFRKGSRIMQFYELVYGHEPGTNRRNDSYEQPDFPTIFKQMNERKNMTLVYLWSRYQKDCIAKAAKPYQYRQFCELYGRWCRENCETLHIQAVIGQKMEVWFCR